MSQLKGVLCKNKNAKRAGVNEAQGWLKEICEGGKVVASAGRESQKLGKRLRYSGRAVLRENVWQTGEDACSRREYRRYILRRHSVLRKCQVNADLLARAWRKRVVEAEAVELNFICRSRESRRSQVQGVVRQSAKGCE